MKTFLKSVIFTVLAFSSTALFADTTPIDDATITQNVQSKISAEPILSNQTISISTNQGVVSLTGTVTTGRQADTAVETAESVEGVQDVDASNLTVKDSKHPMDDSYITAKVKGAFLREKLFGDTDVPVMNIHVDTKNGVVYLTGKADNQDQLSKAISLAQAIKGVKKVDSKVRIKSA